MKTFITVPFARYNYNDQVKKEDEIDRTCSTNGRRGLIEVLVGKPEGTRSLGKPRRRSKDNIKMNFTEIL
jgi:hypothetical protein